MPISVALTRKLVEVDPQLRGVLLSILDEIELQREESVTKHEFQDLTAIVEELAAAQKETQQNIAELTAAQNRSQKEIEELRTTMAELATAQKETRQNIADLTVAQNRSQEEMKEIRTAIADLTAAQNRSQKEIEELRTTMAELATAQKETRQNIADLTAAQNRSQEEIKELRTTMAELATAQKEARQNIADLTAAQNRSQEEMKEVRTAIAELAAAQRETHQQMFEAYKRLENDLKKTRTELGGLSESVGISLEDRALHFLPELLRKDFDFKLEKHFIRKWVRDKKGEPLELDFIGEATKNGDRFIVIGEAKTQLSKNKIDDFLRKKLKPLAGVYDAEIFPIVMTLKTSGIDVEDYAKENGIKRIYYSHELTDRPSVASA